MVGQIHEVAEYLIRNYWCPVGRTRQKRRAISGDYFRLVKGPLAVRRMAETGMVP